MAQFVAGQPGIPVIPGQGGVGSMQPVLGRTGVEARLVVTEIPGDPHLGIGPRRPVFAAVMAVFQLQRPGRKAPWAIGQRGQGAGGARARLVAQVVPARLALKPLQQGQWSVGAQPHRLLPFIELDRDREQPGQGLRLQIDVLRLDVDGLGRQLERFITEQAFARIAVESERPAGLIEPPRHLPRIGLHHQPQFQTLGDVTQRIINGSRLADGEHGVIQGMAIQGELKHQVFPGIGVVTVEGEGRLSGGRERQEREHRPEPRSTPPFHEASCLPPHGVTAYSTTTVRTALISPARSPMPS